MILYLNKNGTLNEINEKSFKLEKEIQKIFEENLFDIMGLRLVKSQTTIKNRRIDTLAFDEQTNSFIIIEYKRDKNASVIDQGFAYLSLMLENKAECIVEYNESLKKNLKRETVDWSQTRVAFVSTSFTENQLLATNFKDIAIELWEIKQFENNTITINQLRKTSTAETIKLLAKKDERIKSVTDEIHVYTEEEHIQKGDDAIKELYYEFKTSIIQLADNIEIIPRKVRIAFKVNNKKFCDISIFKSQLKLWINIKKGKLNDTKKLGRDVSAITHWGAGDYEFAIKSNKDKEYLMFLIKQAIKN